MILMDLHWKELSDLAKSGNKKEIERLDEQYDLDGLLTDLFSNYRTKEMLEEVPNLSNLSYLDEGIWDRLTVDTDVLELIKSIGSDENFDATSTKYRYHHHDDVMKTEEAVGEQFDEEVSQALYKDAVMVAMADIPEDVRTNFENIYKEWVDKDSVNYLNNTGACYGANGVKMNLMECVYQIDSGYKEVMFVEPRRGYETPKVLEAKPILVDVHPFYILKNSDNLSDVVGYALSNNSKIRNFLFSGKKDISEDVKRAFLSGVKSWVWRIFNNNEKELEKYVKADLDKHSRALGIDDNDEGYVFEEKVVKAIMDFTEKDENGVKLSWKFDDANKKKIDDTNFG